jgi:hypothetical protein
MKSKEQILLEDAYARTHGVRNVRDSEVEQMIENIKALQSRAGEMHFRQLEELKRNLEETVTMINSLLERPQAS